MRKWLTEFKAICSRTGELKTYVVIGELIAEIPCKPGTYEPDFDNMTDLENSN